MSNPICYKTENCKEAYCVERTSACYKTDDCNFDYCEEKPTNNDTQEKTLHEEAVEQTGKD